MLLDEVDNMLRNTRIAIVVLGCALLIGNSSAVGQGLDWPAIAAKLVQRMDLQPGERVVLIGAAGRFEPLVAALRPLISGTGAVDLGAVAVSGDAPDDWESPFTASLSGADHAALVDQFRTVDLAVMLPGPTPADPPYAAMQEVLHSGRGRTIHFHWAGAYDLAGNLLPDSAAIDARYQQALLETDYAALHAAQDRFSRAMRGAMIRVTTQQGTDLRFQVGERTATLQDGDASARRAATARVLIEREIEFPSGALRIAPLEGTVAGAIAFPDSSWNGNPVQGLVMTFEGGRVVGVAATSSRAAVLAELEAAGYGGRSFREFALGFNPLLAIPAVGNRWIPYYGYGAGVVRLSLGDNSELGGTVGGGYVRWNFFANASVWIGDQLWVREGELLER